MFSSCHTTIQSLTTCSKKVTDMILYAVSKEMAKALLSVPSEEVSNSSLMIPQPKKRITKHPKKLLTLSSLGQ